MKILVLVESLRINETSSGIVSSTFIKAMIEGDHQVTCIYPKVFTYNVSWLANTKLIPLQYNRHKEIKFINKIPKLRGLISFISGAHVETLSQINDWIIKTTDELKSENYDLIVALGSGSEFLPHQAMLKINTTIPWLANFHDPFPFSLYPEPYKKKGLMNWRQEFIAKKIVKKATYISFPSLYLKEWMAQYFSEINKKSVILPHIGAELKNLPTVEGDNTVFLNKNKFNLLHAGTLLGPRKVTALFIAFQKFLSANEERKNNCVLNILGSVSNEHIAILSSISEYENNFNIITKRVSYQKSIELTKEATVSIVIEADAAFSPFMPGKLADLIYYEKPILALTPKKSETIRILGEDYPYQSRVGDINSIVNNLEMLWKAWKSSNLKLQNAEKLKNYVSIKEFNTKFNNLIKQQ